MVTSFTLLIVLATISTVFATSCTESSHCPESAPCCSQYGMCGVGAYCLGGCDPLSSFSLDSCMPAPVCQSKKHTFDPGLSTIVPISKYLGDPSTADWVASGQPVYHNNNVLLTMAPDTVGTLLASTTYMWYGNVKARFKTSRGRGVVTAFILLSDVKDEIDYEFVGGDLNNAQSNYYSKGVTNYQHSVNISISDTFSTYHTYEINWTPDEITWKIDGKVGRTTKRVDTWNATANQWAYPQTPARVQLSLWPAGLPSNDIGTVNWAGGLVNWDAPDIKNNNYYYAAFESVETSCYNANSGPGTNKGISYTYGSKEGTNDTVIDGQKSTIMKSFLATGLDPKSGTPSQTSPNEPQNSSDNSKNHPETIPGMTGADPSVNDGGRDSYSGTGFSQGNKSSDASMRYYQLNLSRSIYPTVLFILAASVAR
ncbi:putative glycosidase [Podosphaera aphanis]|nr:putative glycosidase [Podosphaera aphanis]